MIPEPNDLLLEGVNNLDIEMIKQALDQGADVNYKYPTGATPLHLASCAGQVAMCKILLDNGANPNARDNDGRTPLLYAVLEHDERIKLIYESTKNTPGKRSSKPLKGDEIWQSTIH